MTTETIDSKYLQYTTVNIQKDEAKGTYSVKYRLKLKDGGVAKESMKRGFKTLREAKLFTEELKRDHAETLYKLDHPELTMTFSELYEKYKISRLGDKPSTIINRESLIQSRVIPFFGEMQIKDITQDTISQWHACFYDDDGQPIFKETYLRSLHSRLSAILNYAVRCGWLTKNPASSCSIGVKNAEERPVWTPEEYSLFRKAIADDPVAFYAFETLYFTGLRKGELLALNIGDINFETNVMSITKSLQVLKGQEVITSPKTKMSVRKVRLNQALADELKEYIATLENHGPKDRLFPLLRKEHLRYTLMRGTEEAGLSPITIHCFRHSHITNLIAAGYSPADIAKRVGHESIYITLHYSHAFKNVEGDIADSLDRIMEGF